MENGESRSIINWIQLSCGRMVYMRLLCCLIPNQSYWVKHYNSVFKTLTFVTVSKAADSNKCSTMQIADVVESTVCNNAIISGDQKSHHCKNKNIKIYLAYSTLFVWTEYYFRNRDSISDPKCAFNFKITGIAIDVVFVFCVLCIHTT